MAANGIGRTARLYLGPRIPGLWSNSRKMAGQAFNISANLGQEDITINGFSLFAVRMGAAKSVRDFLRRTHRLGVVDDPSLFDQIEANINRALTHLKEQFTRAFHDEKLNEPEKAKVIYKIICRISRIRIAAYELNLSQAIFERVSKIERKMMTFTLSLYLQNARRKNETTARNIFQHAKDLGLLNDPLTKRAIEVDLTKALQGLVNELKQIPEGPEADVHYFNIMYDVSQIISIAKQLELNNPDILARANGIVRTFLIEIMSKHPDLANVLAGIIEKSM